MHLLFLAEGSIEGREDCSSPLFLLLFFFNRCIGCSNKHCEYTVLPIKVGKWSETVRFRSFAAHINVEETPA